MRIFDKKGLSGFLKVFLEVLLILGIIMIIGLPFLFRQISKELFNIYFFGGSFPFTLIFVEACAITLWFLLNEIRKIFKTLEKNEPFVSHNVLHLKRSAWLCLTLSVLFAVKTVVDFSLLSPIMIVAFFIACLFCRVLAEVFDKAIMVKSENDLTI